MNPRVQWLAPSPLWDTYLLQPEAPEFRKPALLRFATDAFMEQLQSLLAKPPAPLQDYVAQPETWREPRVGLGSSAPPSKPQSGEKTNGSKRGSHLPLPFKLFQPAHGHFYVVTASLTCRLPGLPEHQVHANKGEQVTLVLRRLRPKAGASKTDCSVYDPQTCDQFAWTQNGATGSWGLAPDNQLAEAEEQLPTFVLPFRCLDRNRRLFAALVPTGRQQSYVAARQKNTADSQASGVQVSEDARKIELQRKVIDPWGDLVEWHQKQFEGAKAQPITPFDAESVIQASAFVLLDFANYLGSVLPAVWSAAEKPAEAAALPAAARTLYASLTTMTSNGITLLQALKNAKEHEQGLENGQYIPRATDVVFLTDAALRPLIRKQSDNSRRMGTEFNAALDEAGAPAVSAVRPPAMKPQNPRGDDWYILRFVYKRPQCGKQLPPVMSEPTRPFQLASYFDPDAPARSIQVALPVDTSPAALSKYDKNVAFMISDQLAKQMSRVKGLKQLMDGDMGPEVGVGMICSFSIPIITICALLVLMIFLMLLNIIFFWMPFFKICFPVPELKAKG
jgi:hypothetical protein